MRKREKNINENKLRNKNNKNKLNASRIANNKINCLFLILLISLFIVLLMISRVTALGITPGRTTLNYESDVEKEIKFSVLNSERKPLKVEFSVQGELKDYVILSNKSVEFSSLEYSKEFSYKINFPDNIKDKPGLHTAEIIALEVPGETAGATHVGATVAVVSQLFVYVSCPGKCVDADLSVLDSELEGTTKLIIPVINRGKQKIEEAKAKIEIFSLSGEKIDEVETDSSSIEPGARTELSAKWKVIKQGDYLAKISVFYDRESKNFEKQFSVGQQMLNIERVWVNDFILGGIAQFRILVENKWNEELKNVFANLIVYDRTNNEIANSKSASENLPSLTKKELLAYWDTANIGEGEYTGKLIVNSEKKSTDKDLVLKVGADSLEIVGYAVNPELKGGTSITIILYIFIGFLILVNLGWLVWWVRTRKKKSKEDET